MTNNENFTAYGWNGDLIVTPDKVTLIHFKGKRQKDILIKHITAIEFQNAGLFAKGHIAFSFHGGQEYHTKALGKGVADINLVQFSKSQEEAFLQAKEMIEKLQKGYQS